MKPDRSLVIRNVEIEGRSGLDVRIEHGRIAKIGHRLERALDDLDAKGGALIPGLADHHIHLMALAAQTDSVVLDRVRNRSEFRSRLSQALTNYPDGAWVRAVGYHELMAGELDRNDLDLIAPRHRMRIQHQTGSLWILNSLALESTRAEQDSDKSIERNSTGRPTGRIWRGDAWLRDRIGARRPSLAAVGHLLAAFGITSATDASVTNDSAAARILGLHCRTGELPQRLTVMSYTDLVRPPDGSFEVGPLKIIIDDHDLPDFDEFVSRIKHAHTTDRAVAVHCVTAAELAVTLAAFEAAGSIIGDRIEHGSIIPEEAIMQLRGLGLIVVTQPGFTRERGDRYAANVCESELPDLNRCASLLAAGIPVAAGSDAPYGPVDPWLSIRTAIDRRTLNGRVLGKNEKVEPMKALSMYLGDPASPGRTIRRVIEGADADLCLLRTKLSVALEYPTAELVRTSIFAGKIFNERA